MNPHFQNLSEEDAKFVIDTIPQFSDKMMSVGLLYEDEMNAVLGSRPGVDNSTPREEHRMSFNDRAIQYQRAAIISRPELLERLAMRKEDSTSSARNKLNKKEEKARVARAALRKVQCPARNVEVLSDETHTTPRRHEMIAANSNLYNRQQQEMEVAEGNTVPPKAAKVHKCFMCHKVVTEGDGHIRCDAKSCRKRFCSSCKDTLAHHKESHKK